MFPNTMFAPFQLVLEVQNQQRRVGHLHHARTPPARRSQSPARPRLPKPRRHGVHRQGQVRVGWKFVHAGVVRVSLAMYAYAEAVMVFEP